MNDPRQRLFIGCSYRLESGKKCSFPVFRTQVPSFCNSHRELTVLGKRTHVIENEDDNSYDELAQEIPPRPIFDFPIQL